MSDSSVARINQFEAIRHEDEEGREYWSARELGPILEYSGWQRFSAVIGKAKTACEKSHQAVFDHFNATVKLIEAGKGARREIEDVHLSRYACYLIVQNADPSKEIVALGQTYFAVQTRRQELQERGERAAGDREYNLAAVARLRRLYRKKGYSDEWIEQRIEKIIVRTTVTTEWGNRGAHEGNEFAQLTDTLSVGTFDITTGEHRQIKQISSRQNLQDSMTVMELALSSLAEATATTLHQERDSRGLAQLERDAHAAGRLSGNARREVEALTGKPVISPINYQQLRQERQRALQPPLLGLDAPDASEGGE